MADAILSAVSDEITEGTALYLDGELTAVCAEGDQLQMYLDGMLDAYKDPNDPRRGGQLQPQPSPWRTASTSPTASWTMPTWGFPACRGWSAGPAGLHRPAGGQHQPDRHQEQPHHRRAVRAQRHHPRRLHLPRGRADRHPRGGHAGGPYHQERHLDRGNPLHHREDPVQRVRLRHHPHRPAGRERRADHPPPRTSTTPRATCCPRPSPAARSPRSR